MLCESTLWHTVNRDLELMYCDTHKNTNEKDYWDFLRSCCEFSLLRMCPSQRERPVQLYRQTCNVAIAMVLEVAEVRLNCYCAHDNERVSLQGVSIEVRVYVLCVYFLCVSSMYSESQRLLRSAYWPLHVFVNRIHSAYSFSANCPNISAKYRKKCIKNCIADYLSEVYIKESTWHLQINLWVFKGIVHHKIKINWNKLLNLMLFIIHMSWNSSEYQMSIIYV